MSTDTNSERVDLLDQIERHTAHVPPATRAAWRHAVAEVYGATRLEDIPTRALRRTAAQLRGLDQMAILDLCALLAHAEIVEVEEVTAARVRAVLEPPDDGLTRWRVERDEEVTAHGLGPTAIACVEQALALGVEPEQLRRAIEEVEWSDVGT